MNTVDRIASWGFAAVLFALWLAVWPAAEQPGHAPRAALIVVALPPLIALLIARPRRAGTLPLALSLLLALLFTAVGLIAQSGPETPIMLRDAALLAIPWITAWAWSRTAVEFDGALARALSVGVLLAAAVGLTQAFLGFDLLPQARAPASTFVNRNVAAEAFVVALPLLWAIAAAERLEWLQRLRLPAQGALILGAAFLAATGSRGALVALGAATLSGWILMRWHALRLRAQSPAATRGRATRLVWMAMTALLIAAVLPVSRGDGSHPSSSAEPERSAAFTRWMTLAGEGSASLEVRRALLWNTLAMIEDQPWWGVGAGRFAVVYPRYHAARVETPGFGTLRGAEHAENDLLEWGAELGLVALAALLVAFLGAIGRGIAALRLTSSNDEAQWIVGRIAALVGVVVHALVAFPLHSPTSAIIAWIAVGGLWRSRVQHSAPRRTVPYVVLGVLFAFAGAAIAGRDLVAQGTLGAMLDAHRRGDCNAVLDAAARLHRLAPDHRRELGIAAGMVFECEREPARSLPLLERALTLAPYSPNLLLDVAARRLAASRADEAAPLFAEVTRLMPLLGRGWLGLAMTELERGNVEAARTACARAMERRLEMPEIETFCVGNALAR